MTYNRIKWIAVAVPALVVGLWEFVRHAMLDPLVPAGFGNLLSAAVVALGAYAFVQMLVRMIEQSAQEAAQAWQQTALLKERQRIAREMHDGVAQAIFYLNVKLAEIERGLATESPETSKGQLTQVRESLNGTYQHVRQVITDLRRAEENEPFDVALRHLVSQFADQSGMAIRLHVQGEGPIGGVRYHLLAILHEALVNAHRHGGATEVEVQAELRPDGPLAITISDNGCGFSLEAVPPTSHGLMIMRERAALAGGNLSVMAAPGQGTRIALRVEEGLGGRGSGSAGG